ncbi:hypothetical protein D3C87_1515480 [compost metagenome]
MSGADVHDLFGLDVSELVGAPYGMFTNVLVHRTTRHDVEELTTTTDAGHWRANTASNGKVTSFLVVTTYTVTSSAVILLTIQQRSYVLTASELKHVSIEWVGYQLPTSSPEHVTVATTITTYDMYLRHFRFPS